MTSTAVAEDRFVQVNGLNLHYLDWGGNSDKTVVMLHGLSGNCHSWDDFATRCRRDYRILAVDQRGHGDSDHAREGYAVTSFASDIHEFVTSLGIGRYDLIGASLGARNAMPYAAEHSDQLKHLIFVDFGPDVTREGAKGVMSRITQRPLGFRDSEQAIDYYAQLNPARSREQLENQIRHSLRLNWAGKLVLKHDPDLTWISGSAGLREVPLLWESCTKITCPTLVMRGETSNILSRETTAKMVEVMPNATSVEVAQAGHGIYVDQPDAFEQIVRKYLAE